MKKFTLLLLTALSVLTAQADDFTGKVATLTKATSLSTGQWYCLYNTTGKKFLKDDASGTLTVGSTPALNPAGDYVGTFVKLESTNDGGYYIVTGEGNYLAGLTSATPTTTTTASASFTISTSDSGSSWTISNNSLYLTASSSAVSTSSTASTWTVYAATLVSETELTASQRITYVTKQLNAGTLARFYCKRNTARYLTSSTSGAATGAALVSSTELSQIWIVSPDGGGYTLRNASTGEFLTDDFSAPSTTSTTLYIQTSPNNGDDDAYFNISSADDFSGNSCLNLGNDGSTLYEWAYSGDSGCDWAVEIVYEVTYDEVVDNIVGSSLYASSITDGAYYRIINKSYDKHMTESSGYVKCLTEDDSNIAQVWQVSASGNGYTIKNLVSDNYIQKQTTTYQMFYTSSTPTVLYITDSGTEMENSWYITNSQGGSQGMHCDASYNVVPWSTSGVDASTWYFLEVEVSDEDLAAAKESLNDYQTLVDNLDDLQTHLDNLFSDKACTTLNEDIAALTDEELEQNADYQALSIAPDIQEMILKVKNDTWAYPTTTSDVTTSYEKFFRIAPYKPYSNYSSMAGTSYAGQSNSYGRLSGPTGIFVNTNDVLYIYVSEDPGSDCTLRVEYTSTEGTPGDHATGTTVDLETGLNVLRFTEQNVIYIFYQLDNPDKYLANYPEITVHIEGGSVNGYFDMTRDMTNQDWANMKSAGLLSQCDFLNLKTEHLVFAMDSELVLEAMTQAASDNGDSMEDAEKLMRVWDMIVANEEAYQGLEDLEGRYRNIWNCFSVDYNYMFATTYGTYYENSTLATVMNYYNMTHQGEGNEGGAMWGPSHEMGHNHQNMINVIGSTESSNNLFSNINLFEQGLSTTRWYSPTTNFDTYLANDSAWNSREISVTTRMFFQLYLYFHAQGHDTEFLPKLFKALREDPLNKGTWDSSLGGYKAYGKNDYLHFAKKCCDVAEADLSEFFESHGMFVPIEDYYCGDYSTYYVTTTEADIASAKAYMQKYEKKLGNIMFIDDHIETKLADPDNKFEGVPESTYKVNCGTYAGCMVGSSGDVGDYEEYDGRTEYTVNNDYYTLTGSSTINFKGSGYVGHKVYDLDGKLIWASNEKSATIPSAIRSKFPDEVVVVAAEANMSDVPCPYYKSGGSYPVYKMQVSFADGVSKQWWARDNIDDYLPENAIAVLGTASAPDALLASTNVVDTDGTAQSIVINGDVACHIPQDITAASLSYTKSGEGYQALSLPFAVSDAQTITTDDSGVAGIVSSATVSAGEPVVVSGDVEYSLSDVAVTSGDYTEAESGYALNSDASAVVAMTDLTPFVYQFDHAFELGQVDAINTILSAPDADQTVIYDLSGRRISRINKQGVYIINGVKTLVR